jgi:predicted phage terminase large subunit-like protein
MANKSGYASPPESARWRKGQSGNPSGKRKKTANFSSDLMAELAELIQVTEGGKTRRITKQRALIKALTAGGIKGNARSAALLFGLCIRLIESHPESQAQAELDPKHHLLHVWRDRVDFPTLNRKVEELAGIFRPNAVLIEDAGSGSALVQVLHGHGVPAVPRKAKDPKTVRLSSVSTYLEAGLMVLPKDAPWLGEFERELLGFPATRYDDQVDSLSQYFGWVRERPKTPFECDWMRDEDHVDHERIAMRLALRR